MRLVRMLVVVAMLGITVGAVGNAVRPSVTVKHAEVWCCHPHK